MAKNKKQKKVIVFGGSGFLGSHVADALTEKGYDVAIYDIKPSKYLQENQKMIVGDILDVKKVEKALKGYDYVYNYAGFSDLDGAQIKPLDTVRLNIMGNTIIMDAAVRARIERFVYASTIYVYSEKGGFYRCSKQAAEIYVEEYQRCYGLAYTILRYSTLYGPRADERNSIYRYLKQAVTEKMIYAGSGDEVRDYIHVRDAARLSTEILKQEFKNRPIIISGHHPVKFKDMVFMVKEMLGNKIEIKFRTKSNSAHYDYTPYSFSPKIGHKLTNNVYLDMGQGLLECLHEIHDKVNKS